MDSEHIYFAVTSEDYEEEDPEKVGFGSSLGGIRLNTILSRRKWYRKPLKHHMYTTLYQYRLTVIALVTILLTITTISFVKNITITTLSKHVLQESNKSFNVSTVFPLQGKLGAMKSISFLSQNTLKCEHLKSVINTSPLFMRIKDQTENKVGIGKKNLFTNDSLIQCLTYSDRFSRYTDTALGITYRKISEASKVKVGYESIHRVHKPNSKSTKEWEKTLRSLMREANTYADSNNEDIKIPDWRALIENCGNPVSINKGNRTAVILRTFHAAVWTEDDVLSTRALIIEMMASRPSAGWGLHILVQVPNDSAVFTSYEEQINTLIEIMPKEFWPFVHFWSSSSARLLFPSLTGSGDLGGPYTFRRDCLMADQIVVNLLGDTDRYDYIQNWEGDIKFTGDYRTLFDAIDNFAHNEPFDSTLRRYSEHFIPGSNKSESKWNLTSETIRQDTRPADLIVFSPIFQLNGSRWAHTPDYGNYDEQVPRVASTISSLRMSMRMVQAYNNATIKHKKSMACEAWPATVVLHSSLPPSPGQTFVTQEEIDWLGGNLKAVYVPHPQYFQNSNYTVFKYEKELLDNKPKAGRYEHFLRESTYSYNAFYAEEVYRKWMKDDYCQEPLLLHPVKNRFS